MYTKKLLLALALAVGTVSATHASVTYTNPAQYGIGTIGVGATTTYGNVFTVANGTTKLDSFSFFVSGNVSKFYGGVAAWNGTGAGPALFTSSTFGGSAPSLTEMTVNTGGLDLAAGQQYVAYFSVAGIPNDSGYGNMSYSDQAHSSAIANGFAWDNASGGGPNHANWNGCQACSWGNFAGTMVFSEQNAVPEPGSLALLGLGAAGLLRVRRRKSV